MTPAALSVLEWTAAAVTLVNVWLVVRANLWNYLPGVFSAALYGWWFFAQKYYGNAALSVLYYLPMQAYGFWVWKTQGPKHDDDLPLRVGGIQMLALGTFVGLFLAYPLYLVLEKFNGSATTLDAVTTSVSVVAQVFLSWKMAENWPIWVGVDAVYVWLFVSQHNWPTAALNVVMTLLAVLGWVTWAKAAKTGAVHAT